MKLARVRIHNILGIEHLDFTPGGKVTKVHGRNGAAKSSIVKSIQSIVQGGSQVKLIRDGKRDSDPSEVYLLIEDEGGEISITKRLSGDRSTAPIVKIDGVAQREPQRLVSLLFDALAVNPIEFLNAKKSDQIQWLLSAMPVTVTKEDFDRFGIDTSGWTIPSDVHGLLVMDQAYGWAYECRREQNVAARRAKDTAARLRDSLPEGSDEQIVAEREALRRERDTLVGELSSYEAQKEAHMQAAIEDARAQADEARSGLQAERKALEAALLEKNEAVFRAKQALADAERDLEAAKQAVSRQDSNIQTVQRVLDKEIAEIRSADQGKTEAEIRGKIRTMDAEIAAVAQRLQAFHKAAGLRAEYDLALKDEQSAEAESKRLDSILKRIEDMKRHTLENLAISDLEIKGDQIIYEGHNLETQNDAKRMILALRVVAKRLKMPIVLPDGKQMQRLPLVCLDGAECLDSETYDMIDQFAEAEGLQMIVTRVTNDEQLVLQTT